jgi:hypothetical protein
MSQKRKSGLQRGLSSIVEAQTAAVDDKTRKSAELIGQFRDPPPPPTTSYHLPPPTTPEDVSPKRDFSKVANSISRDALPAGLFKGTSKKLYDALYQRTRGAISPKREIQARQGDLIAWAGVSHNTLRAHLRHLEIVGLVKRKWELGDNDGATYEVFIPEELTPPPTTSYHPLPSPTSEQKLVGPSNQNLLVGGGGQVPEDSTTSENPKTFIKTDEKNADDEALRALTDAARELTGKETAPISWKPVIELLATELRIAATRTTVSSAPAFLAEHLRRRLFKWEKNKGEMLALTAPPDTTGVLVTPEQIKSCPDCAGTGWWYPDGYEAGTAKCKHEKLTKAE